MAIYPYLTGNYDNNAYTNQNKTRLTNDDGSLATAPVSSTSGGGPQSGTITVTTTAQPLAIGARRTGSEDNLQLENSDDSSTSIFFGPKDTVTGTGATRGHELNPGDTASWPLGTNGASIYVVTTTGTATLVWSVL